MEAKKDPARPGAVVLMPSKASDLEYWRNMKDTYEGEVKRASKMVETANKKIEALKEKKTVRWF